MFRYRYLNNMFRSIETERIEGKHEVIILSENISEVVSKNFLLRPHALEIFDNYHNLSYFFNVFSVDHRKEIFYEFKERKVNVVEDCREYFKDRKFEDKWVKGKLSSFDYLLLINKYSSRSFNDTSQYPIMPWVGP